MNEFQKMHKEYTGKYFKVKRLSKRNNYTLSKDAQDVIDKVPAKEKSKFVSEAIIFNKKA